jgi:Flp pilus assembly protein TadD
MHNLTSRPVFKGSKILVRIDHGQRSKKVKTYALIFWFSLLYTGVVFGQSDRFGQVVDQNAAIHLSQGKRFMSEAKYGQAISSFEKALSHQPNHFAAHYNLGLALTEQKDYSKGIAALERARELREKEKLKDVTIYNSLGWAYILAGQNTDAEKYLLIAEKNETQLITASQARVYNNLGWLYLTTGQLDKARSPLEHASTRLNSATAKQNLALLESVEKKN